MQRQTEHQVLVKGDLPCNNRQKKKVTNSDSFPAFHQRNENILCHLNQNGENKLPTEERLWHITCSPLPPPPPPLSKGCVITSAEKEAVYAFMKVMKSVASAHGQKDKSVKGKETGVRIRKQKHLVLGNLRELNVKFLEDEGHPKIGFSMFGMLCPPHCLAGSVGTHSACVCTHHQNPKLMLMVLDAKGITYHDLIKSGVCDNTNEEGMLHRCKTCPSETGIESFVRELPPCTDSPDEVTFKQWVTVDHVV